MWPYGENNSDAIVPPDGALEHESITDDENKDTDDALMERDNAASGAGSEPDPAQTASHGGAMMYDNGESYGYPALCYAAAFEAPKRRWRG